MIVCVHMYTCVRHNKALGAIFEHPLAQGGTQPASWVTRTPLHWWYVCNTVGCVAGIYTENPLPDSQHCLPNRNRSMGQELGTQPHRGMVCCLTSQARDAIMGRGITGKFCILSANPGGPPHGHGKQHCCKGRCQRFPSPLGNHNTEFSSTLTTELPSWPLSKGHAKPSPLPKHSHDYHCQCP